ncbi:hypothetical protein FNF27_02903 [Cafeteria roenbergensis]|uniref:Sugar phosphate phosphatase n=1 Tax=Cafeteria roenbergensis TaxID=33653 RepID=A0A5A8EHU6_CAFRO|nr:hypothetical protein FNF27_02903 [Cafeteria roenbergensis]
MAAAGSGEGAQPLRPPQLRGIDGKGTFTHTSLAVRLPSIVKELAERLRLNAPGVPSGVIDELRRLADRIAADEPLAELKAPFNSDYNQHLRSAVAADAAAAATEEATAAAVLGGTKGEHGSALARGSWLSLPWWLTEHWAYRCILEIVRPRCGDDFDPFQWHKKEATDHALGALRADLPTIAASGKDLAPLIVRSLWGNRADLSLTAGVVTAEHHSATDAVLLHDDCAAAAPLLASARSVVWVLDNCGLELLVDLAVVARLLARGTSVALHCKPDPVFVSDVMPKDIPLAIEALRGCCEEGAAAAATLESAMAAGPGAAQLSVLAHDYYVSPAEAIDMPSDVRALYAASDMVVVKGDANYRRVTGDRHWSALASMAGQVAPWAPAPLLLLRTLKSGTLAGLTEAELSAGEALGPDWRVSGKCGVIQLVAAPRSE